MTAKEHVKALHPKARHQRFQKNGGGGYTLIFSDYTTFSRRLGEGDTTAKAWTDAWRSIKNNASAAWTEAGKSIEQKAP